MGAAARGRLAAPHHWRRGAARAAPAEARRLPLRARAVQRGRCSEGGAVGRCSGGGAARVRRERATRRCSSLWVVRCAEGRVRRCAAHQGQHHHGSDRHDNVSAVAARGRRGIGAFPPPADVAQQRRHRLLRERQRDREGEVREDRLRGERRDDRSRVPHGKQQPDLHGAHRRRAPWQVVRQRVVRRLRYEDRAASIHGESALLCQAEVARYRCTAELDSHSRASCWPPARSALGAHLADGVGAQKTKDRQRERERCHTPRERRRSMRPHPCH